MISGVKNYVYLVKEYFALSTNKAEANPFTWTCSTDAEGKGTLAVGSLPVGMQCNQNNTATIGCPGAPHVATDAHPTSWTLTPSGDTFSIKPANYVATTAECNNDDDTSHPCGCVGMLKPSPCPTTGFGWYVESTAATCSGDGITTSPCVLCDMSPTPSNSQWSFEWVSPPS